MRQKKAFTLEATTCLCSTTYRFELNLEGLSTPVIIISPVERDKTITSKEKTTSVLE